MSSVIIFLCFSSSPIYFHHILPSLLLSLFLSLCSSLLSLSMSLFYTHKHILSFTQTLSLSFSRSSHENISYCRLFLISSIREGSWTLNLNLKIAIVTVAVVASAVEGWVWVTMRNWKNLDGLDTSD